MSSNKKTTNMCIHLTQKEIEELLQRRIKGAERVSILLHLESCSECRRCVALPTPTEIIGRFINEFPEIFGGNSHFCYGH